MTMTEETCDLVPTGMRIFSVPVLKIRCWLGRFTTTKVTKQVLKFNKIIKAR